MKVRESIKTRLKEVRLEMKLSQIEAAKAVGVAQSTLAGYETGDSLPSYEVLVKLCELYKTSADYLLGLDNFES